MNALAFVTKALLAKERGRSRLFRRGGTHEICVAESHKRTCPRANTPASARAHTYAHSRARAASYVHMCARLYVCDSPGASSGGPISVDHKGPQPSESLRVNNYYRAPCEPVLSAFSLSRPLHLVLRSRAFTEAPIA